MKVAGVPAGYNTALTHLFVQFVDSNYNNELQHEWEMKQWLVFVIKIFCHMILMSSIPHTDLLHHCYYLMKISQASYDTAIGHFTTVIKHTSKLQLNVKYLI